MANPGQITNADQGGNPGSLIPRDPGQYSDADDATRQGAQDQVISSDAMQTLSQGGYGGQQEALDERDERDTVNATDQRPYINQTDMTDETGDTSRGIRR